MSDDIKRFRAIVEGAHTTATAKASLTESVKQPAKMILESIQGQKVSKDHLFGAIVNHPNIKSNEQAVQVLQEMKARLKKSV